VQLAKTVDTRRKIKRPTKDPSPTEKKQPEGQNWNCLAIMQH